MIGCGPVAAEQRDGWESTQDPTFKKGNLMSTRCFIGISMSTHHIHGIYCHSDGGPSDVGKVLLEHYQDPEKIRKLIEHGDVSILGPEIGDRHDFDNPPAGQTTFFARDRGEESDPEVYETTDDFLEHARGSDAAFVYLFDRDRWLVRYPGLDRHGYGPWMRLDAVSGASEMPID